MQTIAKTDQDHIAICRIVRSLDVGTIIRVTFGDPSTVRTLRVTRADGYQGFAFTRDTETDASGTLTVWGDNHATYRLAGNGERERLVQALSVDTDTP